jgi:hypothetical protein
MVRAKFRVENVTKHNGGAISVELWPVTSGSEENKSFWKYTPSGKLTMSGNTRHSYQTAWDALVILPFHRCGNCTITVPSLRAL